MSERPSASKQHRGIAPLQAFQQAIAFQAQGRFWEAEQLYEILLKTDDRHFGSIYRLGLIRLQQGKFDDAARLFRRAGKIDKSSVDAQFHLAVALTGLGRLEEAVERYEKLLTLKSAFPEARNNLGHALELLGRHKEAIAHYEKALAIVPSYAEARNNLGNALQMLGRSEEAIAQYEKALAVRSDYAEAHNNLGNVLATLGRHEEAIAQYEKALAIRSKYAEAHTSLGNALGVLGRYEEAVAHYEKALAINPENAEVRATFGNLLFTIGRSEEAVAHCERALAIRPNLVEARNTLGAALRTLGKLHDAIQAFEHAIALAPKKASAYLNLATSRRFTADDPHFAAMAELARDASRLDVREQIALHFALGKMFADIGDAQQSSTHLLRANSLQRQQITYDEAKMLERFERIPAVFTAELMRDKQGLGDPSPVPVFIIGMPRSGTTLIEQILASHPKVFGAGELLEIEKLAGSISSPNGSGFPEAVATMSGERLCELGGSYLRAIKSMARAAERITDKLPSNFEFAGLIHLALPNARIIHVRRDPRDTALSCFSILFRDSLAYTYDLAELGRHYRGYQALMQHWRNVLPKGVMLEVDYEEVVDNLEHHARRIVAHCGLEWDDSCLAFHRTERLVRTASHIQVRQPIYRTSIGRWRSYEDLLQPFCRALEGS